MMKLTNGWYQYDDQIGTYRAEVNGVIYGLFTNDIQTIDELKLRLPPKAASEITEEEVLELRLQKGEITFEELKSSMVVVKQQLEMSLALEEMK
jgi:hypothetical protein